MRNKFQLGIIFLLSISIFVLMFISTNSAFVSASYSFVDSGKYEVQTVDDFKIGEVSVKNENPIVHRVKLREFISCSDVDRYFYDTVRYVGEDVVTQYGSSPFDNGLKNYVEVDGKSSVSIPIRTDYSSYLFDYRSGVKEFRDNLKVEIYEVNDSFSYDFCNIARESMEPFRTYELTILNENATE